MAPGFLDDVTPVVLTKDEEPNIERTLGQLRWAGEVVVVDSFSRDATVTIARRFANVRVVEHAFDDHAAQWSFAMQEARTAWVLALDADYIVSPEFVAEISALAPPADVDAYEACFRYAVRGHVLHASLYPPRPVLLRRTNCRFFMDGHTHRQQIEGRILRLRESIVHDDRKSFGDFVARQRRYMRREAAKIRSGSRDRLSDRIRALRVVAPFAVVLHSLLYKRLFLDGWPGLLYVWERFVAELILSRELFRPPDAAEKS